MLVDKRFFFYFDKNHYFPVDFIRFWCDLNVVSERNVNSAFYKLCSQKRSYLKFYDFLKSLLKYNSSTLLLSNGDQPDKITS